MPRTVTVTAYNAAGVKTGEQTVTIPTTIQQDNADTLTSRAAAALAANTTFSAIASPTNAQVLAQVKVLTKENTAIIRLLLGLLDDTE